MKEYRLNHIIPNYILTHFHKANTNSFFYLDKLRKVIGLKNTRKRSHLFNLKDFYSKEPLSKLKILNPHIIVNPIFKLNEKPLEINLERGIESPFKKVIDKICAKPKEVMLDLTEQEICKEFLAIQYVRTQKYKEDCKFLSQFLQVPPLAEIARLLVIEIRRNSPSSKLNARSNEVIRAAVRIQTRVKTYWENPNTHSSEIIDKRKRDSFFQILDLNSKLVSILVNTSDIPFVLPDSGVIVFRPNPSVKYIEAVLPITPSLALLFSDKKQTWSIISVDEIIEINRLSYEESFTAIFSNNEAYLKSFLI
jgi:hypothetical protein